MMDMHFDYSKPNADFVAQQLRDGYFDSEQELLDAAVGCMRLRQQRAPKRPTFEEAVRAGIADIEAGRTTVMTEERFDQLVEEGIARAEAGLPYLGDGAALPPDAFQDDF